MDLHAIQIELEQEAVGLGITRYNHSKPLPWRSASGAGKEESETKPGKNLLTNSIEPMVDAIEGFFAAVNTGKAGRRHSAARLLVEIDPYALAYLTARTVINAAAGGAGEGRKNSVQNVAIQLGKLIDDNARFEAFGKADPGLYQMTQKRISKSTSGRHRLAAMRRAISITSVPQSDWSTSDHLRAGEKLIDLYLGCCNIAQLETQGSIKARKNRVVLNLTPKAHAWLREAHDKCAMMAPLRMPMVVPPVDWSNPVNGGYLTHEGRRDFYLIKTKRKNTIDDLFSTDMPELYRAVNAVQSTAWQINESVLNVIKELWSAGALVAGLPPRNDAPLPPKTWDEGSQVDEVTLKEWKKKAAAVYETNAKLGGKRIAMAQTLWMADKFKVFDKIYYPHTVDFRGRLYPSVSFLNPQGDDPSKALLRFAEGKPLGEYGGYWLGVHIANMFGHDKLPLDERAQWAIDNTQMILDSALDPLDGSRDWMKADKPFCALAACFEWAGFQIQGQEFISHLPIAMDGSCSGLQHFSAMLRDSVGGAAVNLISKDRPADIYTEVANKVQARIDASEDTEALCWKNGRVSRKIVKQPTMTYAYNATKYGMREQILSALNKLDEEAYGSYLDHVGDRSNSTEASYLADLVLRAIREVVIAAADAMDWLKQAAHVCNADALPISWLSPIGLPVIQDNREQHARRVKLHFNGQRVVVTVNEDKEKISGRRQVNSIAPNFVHAQDASHLMLTVNACKDEGVSAFSMIHDSFGVHASDTDMLNKVLRETFVDMYAVDWLGEFKDNLEQLLPAKLFDKLPALPDVGTLDLEEVRESDFFFS